MNGFCQGDRGAVRAGAQVHEHGSETSMAPQIMQEGMPDVRIAAQVVADSTRRPAPQAADAEGSASVAHDYQRWRREGPTSSVESRVGRFRRRGSNAAEAHRGTAGSEAD